MAMMPNKATLILNPSSGAPGFIVENVFCLPGVPSILKSMLGGLNNILIGGDPILSKTINLMTYESEIASSLKNVQDNNKDVEIGSYPFFRQGKLGVSIVLRSIDWAIAWTSSKYRFAYSIIFLCVKWVIVFSKQDGQMYPTGSFANNLEKNLKFLDLVVHQ